MYAIGGGRLRASPELQALIGSASAAARARLEQTFLAVSGDSAVVQDSAVRQVVGIFRKILQRGDSPPLDPSAEKLLVQTAAQARLIPSEIPGDLTFEIDSSAVPEAGLVEASLLRSRASHDPRTDWRLDSPEERLFLEIVGRERGPEVIRWTHPQPSLGALLDDPSDHRRADLLFAPPWQAPVIVEIDGLQHRRAEAVDADRDRALRAKGFQVVRIRASDVRNGDLGPLLAALKTPPPIDPSRPAEQLVHGPAHFTRLGLALGEAVERGWLDGAGTWHLKVHDSLGLAPLFLPSLLELFASIDELWAGYLAPDKVLLEFEGGRIGFRRMDIATYAETTTPEGSPDPVIILLDHDLGPGDALPEPRGRSVVARGASLPVRLSDQRAEGTQLAAAKDPEAISKPLKRVLQFVFGKQDFREGQLEALSRVLQRRDCLVLLPTGAGKSLIYQMAGLLLPGRTLIIDPLVALMEDQVEGLRGVGVERAVGMSSFVTQQGLSEEALKMVESGDALFFFIAPERLQQRAFREALQVLTASVPINLAVVDEAHCISEWGHDFRPAYLNLGPLLRRLCKAPDGTAPPILGLTGTASRAVLRDVQIELDLDRADPKNLLKPSSFGREELSFEIVTADPNSPHARLLGFLRGLPDRLGNPSLFQPTGRRDLGIVFCPHVNGDLGVVKVADQLRTRVTPYVGFYSGSAPRGVDRKRWDFLKREAADDFRQGRTTILCATKAFGMGIDIPNVRFTVHFGIPGSIEAFYQEAGRAGRDRRPSYCAAVFSERNPRVNEQLLADSKSDDEVRRIYDSRDRNDRDDIQNQLFFHFNSFKGRASDLEALDSVIDALKWDGSGKRQDIPFERPEAAETAQERAILRLHQVGMVKDYLKEHGRRLYSVTLAEADLTDLNETFLRYVERTQPGRLEERQAAAASLSPSDTPSDRARALAAMALDMVYDSVEKARRRALREMRLLALQGTASAVIQKRIEDYFREGELAPILENLLESSGTRFSQWLEVYRTQTPAEEGELRGSTARLLESYPDHPGLLTGRALAEIMASVRDAGSETSAFEFRDNLREAFAFGKERYSMSDPQAADLLRFLLDQASRYQPLWRPWVWLAWGEAFGSEAESPLEDEHFKAADITHGETVILFERRLGRISHVVDDLVEHNLEA
jgi:ATP-dependent DNA helicase RecQ